MRWIAVTLAGLLALAYALVVLAAPSAKVRPAPDDRGQGGLSLLAAALRDAGYRVAYDRSSRPHLGPDDVAVVPVLSAEGDYTLPDVVAQGVAAGGRAVALGIPKEIQTVGETTVVRSATGREAKLVQTLPARREAAGGEVASAADWSDDEGAVTSLVQVGRGRLAAVDHGALATNRFLGRADDARVVLSAVANVARPGDRLVFLAMGYGEAQDVGPIEAIGPWAVGALWQALGVMAAFGLARGVRFGLPEPERRARHGAREFLDALATFYRKGRRTDAALAAAAREHPEAREQAARPKVSEADARRLLAEIEARPRQGKATPR